MKRVFPVFYFPPISWFAAALRQESILLDQHTHFRKQHLYNRMRIKGPNNVQPLSITVKRTGDKTPLHDSIIRFTRQNWQKNHWKSLEAAYRRSPYFEYYEDRLQPLYEEQTESLLDYNLKTIRLCLKLLEAEVEIRLTETFLETEEVDEDYRQGFSRNGKFFPSWFQPVEYGQVFGEYVPDLSIMDLLCNEGPAARQIIWESWKDPDEGLELK